MYYYRTVDTASLEFEAAPEAYNSVQPTLKLKSVEDNHQKHPPGKGELKWLLYTVALAINIKGELNHVY